MATTKQTRTAQAVYQLHIQLLDIAPPIWRTVWVPDTIRLSRLHRVIQGAVGWTNSHLHEFKIAGQRYGMTDFADEFGDGILHDEKKCSLGTVLGASIDEFVYEYDFGDGWRHLVRVEKILPANEYNIRPVCIDGDNAGPPEDVGGSGGYASFVEIMADPTHEEHLDLWRWHGGPFNPRGFDISAVNERIRRMG